MGTGTIANRIRQMGAGKTGGKATIVAMPYSHEMEIFQFKTYGNHDM